MNIHNASDEQTEALVKSLCSLPRESEWLEFKKNKADPADIGEYISALANTAALQRHSHAYMLWGISDVEHKIEGTQFVPSKTRVGNEELENWLAHHLNPRVGFQFREAHIEGKRVVILEISPAIGQPVRFKNEEFIRVGTYKKKLRDFPDKERQLWRTFQGVSFEYEIAAKNISAERVLELLNWQAYFRLVNTPEPKSTATILESLANERLIIKDALGQLSITNVGAIALAKRLSDFPNLNRKAIRVVSYEGKNKLETRYESVWEAGYASQFEDLVKMVASMLPRREKLTVALRTEIADYPPIAIRELLANALIHQDFTISGTGPMLEIFVDRIEITNPGIPLVETARLIDSPPRSRNEALASLFRRFGICEERGSGIDKVIAHVEKHHLPPPLFETAGDFTRCILFGPSPKIPLDKEGRIRACYFHACLYYVSRDFMTNSSLRERFGIKPENKAMVSRYIKETIEAGMIRPLSNDVSKKNMKYVPYWV